MTVEGMVSRRGWLGGLPVIALCLALLALGADQARAAVSVHFDQQRATLSVEGDDVHGDWIEIFCNDGELLVNLAPAGVSCDAVRQIEIVATGFGNSISVFSAYEDEYNELVVTMPSLRDISVQGGPGADDVVTFGHVDTQIRGGPGNDDVETGGGHDVVRVGGGNDTIVVEDGNDTVLAGSGFDEVLGGRGNDDLKGGKERDIASGGSGRDRCRAEVERHCER